MASREDEREELEALRKWKNNLEQAAHPLATVICADKDKAVVNSGCGPMAEVELPQEWQTAVGDRVILHPMTMQIMKKVPYDTGGRIVSVRGNLNDGRVEIESEGHLRTALLAPTAQNVTKGCRVLMDSTGCVIQFNYGKPAENFVRGETPVSWEEIGGLENIKSELQEVVEFPHKYPIVFKSYNHKTSKGVALTGPPGCGKTMLGKAVATSLADTYDSQRKKGDKLLNSGFLYVKGPEILNKFVGESESTIRGIFARAADHKQEFGFPAIIFIDEADAVLNKRGSGISSDVEKTIVTSFLAEMDGMDESGAIVILATNRSDRIDPAILRDGRIDKKLFVTRPDQHSFQQIMDINFRNIPLAPKTTIKGLTEAAVEYIWDDKHFLGEFGSKEGQGTNRLFLRDLVSGAMAANCVNESIIHAIRRDIRASSQTQLTSSKFKPSGVTINDVFSAVESLREHAAHVNHDDVLDELAERKVKSDKGGNGVDPKAISPPAVVESAVESAVA